MQFNVTVCLICLMEIPFLIFGSQIEILIERFEEIMDFKIKSLPTSNLYELESLFEMCINPAPSSLTIKEPRDLLKYSILKFISDLENESCRLPMRIIENVLILLGDNFYFSRLPEDVRLKKIILYLFNGENVVNKLFDLTKVILRNEPAYFPDDMALEIQYKGINRYNYELRKLVGPKGDLEMFGLLLTDRDILFRYIRENLIWGVSDFDDRAIPALEMILTGEGTIGYGDHIPRAHLDGYLGQIVPFIRKWLEHADHTSFYVRFISAQLSYYSHIIEFLNELGNDFPATSRYESIEFIEFLETKFFDPFRPFLLYKLSQAYELGMKYFAKLSDNKDSYNMAEKNFLFIDWFLNSKQYFSDRIVTGGEPEICNFYIKLVISRSNSLHELLFEYLKLYKRTRTNDWDFFQLLVLFYKLPSLYHQQQSIRGIPDGISTEMLLDGFNVIYQLDSNPYLSIEKSNARFRVLRRGYWYTYEDTILTLQVNGLLTASLKNTFSIEDADQYTELDKGEFCASLESLLWDYVLQKSIFYPEYISKFRPTELDFFMNSTSYFVPKFYSIISF